MSAATPPPDGAPAGDAGASTRRIVTLVVVVVGMIAVIVAGVRITARPRALLLGDSITWISSSELSRLQDQYRVTIDGWPGYRVDEMIEPAQQAIAADRPDRAVVNLGTNDVLQGTPIDTSFTSFDRLAGLLGRACVRVVTVNEQMQGTDSPVRPRAVAFNRRLRDWAAERGYGVIDWSAAVREHEQAGEPGGPLTTDSVHPNPAGGALLTDLYRDGLATCG